MEEILQVGVTKKFQILEINPEEHRMSLKLAEPLNSAQGEQEGDEALESQQTTPAPEEQQAE